MGITLAVLKIVGYIPEEKERLKISTRWVEIYFFSNFNILFGILFEPEDLLSLREREREREREKGYNGNNFFTGCRCNKRIT